MQVHKKCKEYGAARGGVKLFSVHSFSLIPLTSLLSLSLRLVFLVLLPWPKKRGAQTSPFVFAVVVDVGTVCVVRAMGEGETEA